MSKAKKDSFDQKYKPLITNTTVNEANYTSVNRNKEISNATKDYLIKEIQKVRDTYYDQCQHLNKVISENEEFNSKKFKEINSKLKSETVAPFDVDTVVDVTLNRKLSKHPINKSIDETHNRLDQVLKKMESYQNEVGQLRDEIEHCHEKYNILEQEKEDDKAEFIKRLDFYEKALNDVRDESIANLDSYMVSVDEKIDQIQGQVNKIDRKGVIVENSVEKNAINNVNISNEIKQEVQRSIDDINSKVSKLDKNERLNQDNIKMLSSRIMDLKKSTPVKASGKTETMQKNSTKGLRSGGSVSSVVINETSGKLSAPVSSSTTQISNSTLKDISDIKSKINELQKVALSHGEVLDDIELELSQFKTIKNTTIIERDEPIVPVISQTDLDDIDKRLKNLEDNSKDLYEKIKFKDEVYNELDEIKIAAASDIKDLDTRINGVTDDIVTVETRINGVQDEVGTVETRINDVQDNIVTLKTQLKQT